MLEGKQDLEGFDGELENEVGNENVNQSNIVEKKPQLKEMIPQGVFIGKGNNDKFIR